VVAVSWEKYVSEVEYCGGIVSPTGLSMLAAVDLR
jgi:hypothetical protein